MENPTKDYTEGYWFTSDSTVPLRSWVYAGGSETTLFTIDSLPDWIEEKVYGSPSVGITFRYPYASRNRGNTRSAQCTNSDGTKFFLVQTGNASLWKTEESVSAVSGSTEVPVSFEDGESYEISASSDSEWASASIIGNSVVVRYSANPSGNASRTANVTIRCIDSENTVWPIGVFALTQGVSGTLSFKNKTESATHESGSRFSELNALGALGDINATSSASWLRAEASSGGVLLSWDKNTGSVVRSAEVSAVSETGATATLNFVQSFDSSSGSGSSGGSEGSEGSGSSGIVGAANGKKHLTTWQHSADSAYVLCYYNARNEDAGRVAAIDVIDMSEERLGRKLASVVIDPFSGDASELKFYSVNDVVYITHSSMRPKKLTRNLGGSEEAGGYAFTLGEFDIKIDPVLSEYFDRNVFSVTRTGTIETGESVNVYEKPLTNGQTANGAEPLFTSTSSWRAGQMLMLKKSTQMMKTWGFMFTGTDESAAINTVPKASTIFEDDDGGQGKDTGWIFAFGKVSIETSGKWSGRLVAELWRPDMETDETGEPVNPEQIAVMEVVNAMQNRNVTRDILEAGSRIRVRCEKRERAQFVNVTTKGDNVDIVYRKADNDTGCYVTISAAAELPVYLRIASVTGPIGDAQGYATCTAIHPFEGGFDSSSFAEGAWCEKYGFPKTCGVFQERMAFGGNTQKPCTLWLSKTGDWSNFVQGSESTSPIFATANTDNIDAIQWMQIAKSYIMFGSLSGEWYFGGSDGGGVKPTNYSFQRLSNFGSTQGVDAVLFGESTLVAKNGGRQVVDVSYNTLSEQGNGTDLTIFAAHLFEETTITDMAATISPSAMLWTLLENGMLLSFTYETNNNVFGWARHTIHDGVEAITNFRRGERDLLAMIVNDGNDVTLCELDPHRGEKYATAATREEREAVFMDQHADGSLSRYESRMIPTPIASEDGLEYGHVAAFNAFDVYLKTHNGAFENEPWAEGTEFTVKLNGDDREHFCDAGWLKSNVKTDFGENRVQLDLNTGYSDTALCDIKTDYPAPLTITAIGASFAHGN